MKWYDGIESFVINVVLLRRLLFLSSSNAFLLSQYINSFTVLCTDKWLYSINNFSLC